MRGAEVARQVAAQAAQRRQPHADAPRGRRGVRAAHRVDAAERLVEHEAERVEVRGRGRAAALGLLGRHVGERADDVAGRGQRVVAGDAGDAEVGQLGDDARRLGRLGDQDVAGLDVAVDDAARVRVRERVAQRDADQHDVAVGQRAVGAAARASVCAAHELGDQVDGVVVAAGLVERDDRRVRQPRGGQRLALGPRARRPRRATGMRLTATSRSSRSSRASQTAPKPPAPSSSQQRVAVEDERLRRAAASCWAVSTSLRAFDAVGAVPAREAGISRQ